MKADKKALDLKIQQAEHNKKTGTTAAHVVVAYMNKTGNKGAQNLLQALSDTVNKKAATENKIPYHSYQAAQLKTAKGRKAIQDKKEKRQEAAQKRQEAAQKRQEAAQRMEKGMGKRKGKRGRDRGRRDRER